MSDNPLQDLISSDGYGKIAQLFDDVATLKARECQLYLSQFPRARVYNDANINLPDSAITPLTFNKERWDTDNIHSTVLNTGRLTAPIDGLYLISAHAVIEASGVGERVFYIRLDGALYIAEHVIDGTAAFTTKGSISTQYYMTAGQYAEFLIYQNSGGPLITTTNSAYSPEFAIALIGPG